MVRTVGTVNPKPPNPFKSFQILLPQPAKLPSLRSTTVYYRNVFCERNLRHKVLTSGSAFFLFFDAPFFPIVSSVIVSYHMILFYVFKYSGIKIEARECLREKKM